MPGGIEDVSEEERRRREAYLRLIGGLARDGGALTGPPIDDRILDEELLDPEAATRAADAAAVAPQEWGNTSPTLLQREEPEPEPMVDRLDRKLEDAYQLRQQQAGAQPAPDPIDAELLPPMSERAHIDAAMRQQLPQSTPERFTENLSAINSASPPVTPPPAGETETSLTPEVSRGARPDLYGHDDEVGFTRAQAIAQAREAYAAETARRDAADVAPFDKENADRKRVLAPDGQQRAPVYTEGMSQDALDELTERGLVPDADRQKNLVSTGVDPGASPNPYGPSESRWEDEFLKNHEALTDRQIRARTAVIGLFGGLLGGDPNMARDYANREFRVRAGYDQGLAQARARDKGDQRIDQGLAEAMAATGNVSPEEAARLTYNSPLVSAYQNGMYAQGLSAERLERMAQQFHVGEQGKTLRSREQTASDERQTGVRAATQLTQAEILAGRKGQGAGAELSPEQETLIAANLVDRFNLPLDVGRAAVRGRYEDVPEALQNRVEAAVVQGKVAVRDRIGERGLSATPASAAATGEVRAAQSVRTARKKQAFTSAAWKERQQVRTVMSSARRARAAWDALSDEAKSAYVKVGPKAWPALRQVLGTEKYQAEITNLKALSNELVRMEAGLSQTQSELTNQMEAQGIAPNWWAPLNDPAAYDEFLDRITERTRQRYQSLKADGVWDAAED